jgi:hypothetical protein
MNTYKTRDLSLASLLCSCDYKMTNYTIDPISGAFWFHFEDSEAVENLAKSFYLSTATANVARYNAATKKSSARLCVNWVPCVGEAV